VVSGRPRVRRLAEGFRRPAYANPSAALAAELDLARVMAERGRWPALAAAAAPEAVLFVPQPVWARVWLKGRADGTAAVTERQVVEVWSSCDGSVIAVRGGWRAGGQAGWFVDLWQRQDDGALKWIVAEQAQAAEPLVVPDMVPARVADCPDHRREPEADGHRKPKGRPAKVKVKDLPPLDPAGRAGTSADGSLRWSVAVAREGSRRLVVSWTKDGASATVLDRMVPAPTQ